MFCRSYSSKLNENNKCYTLKTCIGYDNRSLVLKPWGHNCFIIVLMSVSILARQLPCALLGHYNCSMIFCEITDTQQFKCFFLFLFCCIFLCWLNIIHTMVFAAQGEVSKSLTYYLLVDINMSQSYALYTHMYINMSM